MTGKILIVGQAPSRKDDGVVLGGRVGARISSWAGISLDEYLRRTERVNVLWLWPGAAQGGGDRFPASTAALAAEKLSLVVARSQTTVLLGKNVAKAFGVKIPVLTWTDAFRDQSCWLAVCPHPSGINRFWNDPLNVVLARTFWRDLFRRD